MLWGPHVFVENVFVDFVEKHVFLMKMFLLFLLKNMVLLKMRWGPHVFVENVFVDFVGKSFSLKMFLLFLLKKHVFVENVLLFLLKKHVFVENAFVENTLIATPSCRQASWQRTILLGQLLKTIRNNEIHFWAAVFFTKAVIVLFLPS